MWILISVIVVAIVVVGGAALFVNAVRNAFSPFSNADRTLFRWPDGWWPKGKRWPLPTPCIAEADRHKEPPMLNLVEIDKAVAAFAARTESLYATHKGEKSQYSKDSLAEARARLAQAIERREGGEIQELTWTTYASACDFYAFVIKSLKPPA
jgi:hypothetical protein